VLVRGLDSTQIDMVRLAIDVSVCDPTGASNLTEVRKAPASSSRPCSRRNAKAALDLQQRLLKHSPWRLTGYQTSPFIRWASI
jgi:hypothetical protein